MCFIINGTTAGDGTGSTYTQLSLNGKINVSGAILELSGTYVPTTFVIGVNDGTDPVIGNFSGLPEGGTIVNILGSGLNATITYLGGDGNDIVLVVQSSSCTPPAFTSCPTDIVVPTAPGVCGANVTYAAIATGSPAPTLSHSFSGATTGSGAGTGSGSFFNVGTTTVTITATNGCPPDASCSFQITVNDIQAPTITCPPTQTLTLGSNCQASSPDYTGLATANDNCPGTATVSQSPAPGTTVSGVGPMTVTLTATDASGNTASCVFTVNKVGGLGCGGGTDLDGDGFAEPEDCDDTNSNVYPGAPEVRNGVDNNCNGEIDEGFPSLTITCPTGVEPLTANASCRAVLGDYTGLASVSGGCGGSLSITQVPASGTIVNPGTVAIKLTVTNSFGQSAQCIFNIGILGSCKD